MQRPFSGALFAVAAYLTWGLVAIYWKALGPVPALEVLAHRVVWSTLFLGAIVGVLRGWGAVALAFRTPKVLRTLCASTALISVNWGLFIWAIQSGHLVETSLGYYINPLFNVALGVFLLGERLRRFQVVAVGLALSGVLFLTVRAGVAPTLALTLAATFGLYGLLRKTANVDAITGLFVETTLLTPLALAYIVFREVKGVGAIGLGTPAHGVLLAACGVVTALPLMWFSAAARRMSLSTMGFFQYISPTCQLLLGVFLYGERATRAHAVAFALIWGGLLVYSLEALVAARSRATNQLTPAARPAASAPTAPV